MESSIEQSIIAGGSLILFGLILALLPTILCIVLFFKIWIMTNDVSKIKEILQEQLELEHPYVDEEVVEQNSDKSK